MSESSWEQASRVVERLAELKDVGFTSAERSALREVAYRTRLFSDALTCIEQSLPNGIPLVAGALIHADKGMRSVEGRTAAPAVTAASAANNAFNQPPSCSCVGEVSAESRRLSAAALASAEERTKRAEAELAKMQAFLKEVSSETAQEAVARADVAERKAQHWRDRCADAERRTEKVEAQLAEATTEALDQVAALTRALTREREELLGGCERLSCHALLAKGGEWLGAARSWLQRHTRNGESVTWGSDDVIEHRFTVAEIERLASEIAAAAMRPQPNAERLGHMLKARWDAERQRDAAVTEALTLTRERNEAREGLSAAVEDITKRTTTHREAEALRTQVAALTRERNEALARVANLTEVCKSEHHEAMRLQEYIHDTCRAFGLDRKDGEPLGDEQQAAHYRYVERRYEDRLKGTHARVKVLEEQIRKADEERAKKDKAVDEARAASDRARAEREVADALTIQQQREELAEVRKKLEDTQQILNTREAVIKKGESILKQILDAGLQKSRQQSRKKSSRS